MFVSKSYCSSGSQRGIVDRGADADGRDWTVPSGETCRKVAVERVLSEREALPIFERRNRPVHVASRPRATSADAVWLTEQGDDTGDAIAAVPMEVLQ
jgi:hypothetical protein